MESLNIFWTLFVFKLSPDVCPLKGLHPSEDKADGIYRPYILTFAATSPN